MKIIPTEVNNLNRDLSSKAILITDEIARLEFKKKQLKNKKELEAIYSEIESLRESIDDINTIKEEINEIKSMLKSFCSK
jgi:hypothetical protein